MFCHNRQRIESLYFCRAPSEITREINQGKSMGRPRQVRKEELKYMNTSGILNKHLKWWPRSFLFSDFKHFILYWSIADLQCYGNFRWAVKGLSHAIMYLFTPKCPSHAGCHIALCRVSCAIQQILIGHPFWIRQSVRESSKFPNYPFCRPLSLPTTISLFSKSVSFFLFCK